MDQITWSKSLLATYNALPLVVKCIDRSNMQMALGSFSYPGNVIDLMNKMLSNNARKEALVNAKVLVDSVLAKLEPRHRSVLEMRYFKRRSFEQIAKELNVCMRSVFRWHELALKQFSRIRISKGYDDEWLSKYYSKDPVFVKCIRYCKDRDEREITQINNSKEQSQDSGVNIVLAMSATSPKRNALGV